MIYLPDDIMTEEQVDSMGKMLFYSNNNVNNINTKKKTMNGEWSNCCYFLFVFFYEKMQY